MKNEHPKRAVIFDFIRTLYDPVSANLYNGARAMLNEVSEDRQLILYSRRDRSRLELLEEMEIADLFAGAYFVDKKDADNLRDILKAHSLTPETCIVVGDMISSELVAAGELGIETIWFRQQSFASVLGESYVPTHTVNSIAEMHRLISRLP
ncbi:MAG: hypothetical protein JWM46_372 [Candidatus Kaiserbacteria bacterium]|nr:hypothetical protein [Candidatus Kaiserbacteria bacterium]